LIYIVSTVVFFGVIFLLVGVLLLVEAKVAVQGECKVLINDDQQKSIATSAGKTLLASLLDHDILIPCACGGKGTCGTCKVKVEDGGGDVLPTELSLVSRRERLDGMRLSCQLKVKQDLRIRIPEEIFNIRKYNGTVVSNRNVSTFIKELVVELDKGEAVDFEAGAYMQIDVPEYEASFEDFEVATQYRSTWQQFNLLELVAGSDEPVNRAYSLANPPSEKGILKFTIRIATPPPNAPDAPPGVGSSFVFNLRPGDRITLSGPYGDFFVKQTRREMCFIGGGAGMAPMRSHIRNQLLDVGTDRTITFWYGARSRQEMFYDDEFRELADRFDNFTYTVALSDPQPGDRWDGPTGYIHQVAHDRYLKDHPEPDEIEYYLCGPPMMIDAVMKMLDSLGVEKEMIAFDDFG
jgi:Na+-transporting NADH:ubiquinone oxidoreductase subunit F